MDNSGNIRSKYLTLIFIIISSALYPQGINSDEDYIITNQDDTIYGRLKIPPGISNKAVIENEQKISYDKEEIKEFRKDSIIYESVLINGKEIFCQRFVKGPVSLYKGEKVSLLGVGLTLLPIATLSDILKATPPSEQTFFYFSSATNGNMKFYGFSRKNIINYFSEYEPLAQLIQNEVLNSLIEMTNIYNNWILQNEEHKEFENTLKRSHELFENDTILYSFKEVDSVKNYFKYLHKLLEVNFFIKDIKIYSKEYRNGRLKRKGYKVIINKEGFNFDHWYPVGCWYSFEKDGTIRNIQKFNIHGRKVK